MKGASSRGGAALAAIACSATLALALAPRVARAQDFPKVFVLPMIPLGAADAKEAAAKLTELLKKELGGSNPITLESDLSKVKMDEAVAVGPAVPGADAAGELLKKGIGLKDSNPEEASKVLKGAVAAYEEALPSLADIGPLAEAILHYGDALFRAGFQDDGEDKARLFLAITGGKSKLPKGKLEPTFGKLVEKRMAKLGEKATGSIAVESTPPGAAVTIDTKAAGVTPLTAKDLPPGLHYVVVSKEGYEAAVEKVMVKGNATSEARLELKKSAPLAKIEGVGKGGLPGALEAAIGSGRITDEGREALAAFAEAGGSAFVVFGYAVRDGDVFLLRPYLFQKEGRRVAELTFKAFDSALSKTEVGIATIATTSIKGVYSFPTDLEVKKGTPIVIPVPEAAPAKVKLKKTRVEDEEMVVDDESPEGEGGTTKGKLRSKRVAKAEGEGAEDGADDEGAAEESRPARKRRPRRHGRFDAKELTKKWWFWTAIGVVAVGVGGGVALAVTSKPGMGLNVEW